ncbi:uncharacterized protein LOC107519645 isoform X2 [Rousettus aegyptiacus]|uniref:uncharacterized protein LOC107519645 isoform X2 n=1 Tax=Rousettus aegyptiacus TaxID=9407 RepID=UPI00168CC5CB|nr:uncharacterized protein LOC107519645 isoform X2 [Rousettus aegyptiacus]
MTGGHRCRQGRNLTSPAGSCATGASWRVGRSLHPFGPALGKSLLGTRGKGNTSPWTGKTCSVGCSRAHSLSRQPRASPVCQIHSPGFGNSSKGSELETDRTQPSPQAPDPSSRGPRPRRGGTVWWPCISESRPPCLAGLGRLVGTRRGGSAAAGLSGEWAWHRATSLRLGAGNAVRRRRARPPSWICAQRAETACALGGVGAERRIPGQRLRSSGAAGFSMLWKGLAVVTSSPETPLGCNFKKVSLTSISYQTHF